MAENKQIKIGAILSYISIAVNIIAGLLYTPWVVNQIGQSQYGLYTLANSLITLFLVDFGLSSATARYVSKYNAEGNQEKVNNFLGVIYKLYLIVDAIIFTLLLIVFIFIDKIYVNLTPEELEKFKIVYIISATFAIFNFPFVTQNGVLTAYEKFIPLKLADVIYRLILVLLTVVALLLGYGLYALVAMHAVAGLIIILYKFIVIKRSVPVKANFRYSDKSLYKDIFGFSIWTTIAMLAQRLVFSITPTILGITVDTAAIAVFGIVVTIEGYFYTITTAINGMFMPKISKAYAVENGENAEKNIETLFFGVGRFQFALNGLLIVGFAVLGKQFLNLWMGSDYSLAYYGILLVTIPGLFYNSLQIANTTMVVRKKVNLQAIINVVTGGSNIILSFIFSALWGVVGACLSIFIAYMLRAILVNVISQKVLKFNVVKFARICYVKIGFSIIIATIISLVFNMIIPDKGWLMFVAKGVVVVIVYLLSMLFLATNSNERKILRKKLLKR